MRFIGAGLALLASCAAPRGNGALHIAATHYESMVGVKVGSGDEAMTCSRDTITGSHILRWYCQLDGRGPIYQFLLPVQFDMRVR